MGRRRSGQPVHGWLVLDKPIGLSSTVAVSRVRRLFNAQKAGHAGTLDPLGFGERGVLHEAQLGRELELDRMPELAAQEAAVAIERRHDDIGVLTAQGLHEDRRVAHVG